MSSFAVNDNTESNIRIQEAIINIKYILNQIFAYNNAALFHVSMTMMHLEQ